MLKTAVILLASAIFAFCESAAILEKINKKCGISDSDCQRDLFRSILADVTENGLPEMGIPKLDPLEAKDMEMVVLGMIKVTMKDGSAKGLKSCSSNIYKIDMEKLVTSVEYACDLFTFEGDYKLESTPTLLALSGGINVHGEGKGSIVIENVKLNLEFPFELKKLDDGEIHFQMKPEESTYTFEVLGKVTAAADNIFVGNEDISTVAVNIFNNNWKAMSNILGRPVLERVMGIFHENVQKFFDTVPAKEWITDDLSSYVKS